METRLFNEILENEYINRKNNFKKQRAHPQPLVKGKFSDGQ